jgi:methylenetetrahydrofolate dehydrogenase (NADP+)/methenyltetrahydrofolate cyclohydrolase
MATIIDGRAAAAGLREEVRAELSGLASGRRRTPGLATILIGDDPASAVYVATKRKACAEAGIQSFHHPLPGDVSQREVCELIARLNEDAFVSGILCQLPLPQHLDADFITNCIHPDKDVDGLTIASAGRLALGMEWLRPCTPAGVMRLLAESGVELAGLHAVVIGRSNLFGKPMAQLLLAADATVTTCHRHTKDLPVHCRQADVLIVAVGRPRMVRGDWVKPGAVVIDVGINRTDDGIVGDVDFHEASQVAGAITPVPGGVGPMTIAYLLRNTVEAAGAQLIAA